MKFNKRYYTTGAVYCCLECNDDLRVDSPTTLVHPVLASFWRMVWLWRTKPCSLEGKKFKRPLVELEEI